MFTFMTEDQEQLNRARREGYVPIEIVGWLIERYLKEADEAWLDESDKPTSKLPEDDEMVRALAFDSVKTLGAFLSALSIHINLLPVEVKGKDSFANGLAYNLQRFATRIVSNDFEYIPSGEEPGPIV
jgi:hypothetical protein